MRRWLIGLIVALCLPLASWAQTEPRIYWDHDGVEVTRFECVIDSGTPQQLGKPTPTGTTYSALLSACGTLTSGAHQVYIRACNATGCTTAAAVIVVKL